MITIDVLKKGDEVLNINERFLAVKREDGTVDIYNMLFNDTNEIFVDPVKCAVIGYGEGLVGKQLDDGETKVYTF
ncbi:MAG: hypothetical protein Q4C46_07275 [Bacillota bacterium]|nr:hypothetical protein [Bacillota bacterium]